MPHTIKSNNSFGQAAPNFMRGQLHNLYLLTSIDSTHIDDFLTLGLRLGVVGLVGCKKAHSTQK